MLRIADATEEEIRSVIDWIDEHPVIGWHIMAELSDWVLMPESIHFPSVPEMLSHFDWIEISEKVL